VKRLPWIGLALALALAACGRPTDIAKPPAAAPAGPLVERAGPIRWNAASGGFELGGKPLKTVKLWTFDGSTEGFTPVGSKVSPAPGSGLSMIVADPTLRSPKGLNVPGGQFPLVLVRLTRTAPATSWDGALYYSTAQHGEGIGFFGKPVSGADPAVGETTTLVYDMSRQAAGNPDWVQSTIDQIRLDLEDRAGGGFLIRQIAIAENPDPAAIGPATGATTRAPAASAKPAAKS
jgi:hypothetical protein